MLSVIAAISRTTKSVSGSTIMSAIIGVHQVSPTSCLLFVLFLNELVKMYKSWCKDNGLLNGYILDDAVIVARTRKLCLDKLKIMIYLCDEYMVCA